MEETDVRLVDAITARMEQDYMRTLAATSEFRSQSTLPMSPLEYDTENVRESNVEEDTGSGGEDPGTTGYAQLTANSDSSEVEDEDDHEEREAHNHQPLAASVSDGNEMQSDQDLEIYSAANVQSLNLRRPERHKQEAMVWEMPGQDTISAGPQMSAGLSLAGAPDTAGAVVHMRWQAEVAAPAAENEISEEGMLAARSQQEASSLMQKWGEPLSDDRVSKIKATMAGLVIAAPPPRWATVVPEEVWKTRLLSHVTERTRGGHSTQANTPGASSLASQIEGVSLRPGPRHVSSDSGAAH
eukprot:CAMPEP_0119322320 /NCGR_PEP_ID=MMETSP1333-20130426/57836_1 /TAXON_ID=418940 /ORGANISM="Scyphosphaera apsteinii, Strain RCC1455" /LENGTH=298 /DNA_ID=CAMNT_0007329515 /DNA_START=84 /DNA_END=980 /DNA_ORIENTATION=-